tara:strand:+ start:160 stop:318 length:159 start_codon:yes stop_codon:yes gene_type:complete
MLLAPHIVDPHSFLESPFNGTEENIYTLTKNGILEIWTVRYLVEKWLMEKSY